MRDNGDRNEYVDGLAGWITMFGKDPVAFVFDGVR